MRRSWGIASLAAGLGLWSVAAATFVVEMGAHDVSEGIGLLAFLIGLFLVWEGGFGLWRSRALARRDKPK